MRTCPKCQKTYPDETAFCSRDGTALPPVTNLIDPQLVASLARRYRIIQRLGGGGMGAVFLAEQLAVGNRPVALKVLLRKLLDDPEFLLRFHNEAASTGRIRHPNVVTIYECDQAADGTPYIAMEYLEGKTLRQVLKSRGELPVGEVVEIVQQAARGLNAAHRLGIIHRDLKPDNIFLTRGGEGELLVKVVDFGIAKLLYSAGHTMNGVMLGTPAYMSAEQASGMHSDELDVRSDVYSLGIVAYEMLAGRLPFESDTPLGFVRKHAAEPPPPLQVVRPDLNLPLQTSQAIMKALHKDRNQRYPSTVEFARELAEAVQPSQGPRGPGVPSQGRGVQSHLAAQEIYGDLSASAESVASTGVETPPPMPVVERETFQKREPVVSPGGAKAAPPRPPSRAAESDRRSPRARTFAARERAALVRGSAMVILAGLALLAVADTFWRRAQRARAGMVYIHGGSFMMGRDGSPEPAESPAHLVTVAPFYLDRTPVTNAQYAEFARATHHAAPSGWGADAYPRGQDEWPVTDVTWDDAQAYAEWKSRRLPTEAEWEFAARGSDGRLYPWGNNFNPRFVNSAEAGLGHPQPVAIHPKAASPFGVLDMSGNVWQWCQDAYAPYRRKRPQFEIPITAKVIRGGSFDSDRNHVTTTARNLAMASSHSHKIGFRCAKTPPRSFWSDGLLSMTR